MTEELTQEQRGELIMLGERLGQYYGSMVKFYQELYKAYPDDPSIQATAAPDKIHGTITQPLSEFRFKEIIARPLKEIGWDDLHNIANVDHSRAVGFWEGIKKAAADYVSSGMFACDTLGSGNNPWERAQFISIRKMFFDDWKPTGAIEVGMIEMLAQSFISYHHWLSRANSMAAREYEASENPRTLQKNRYGERPTWDAPRLDAAEAIDRALALADRFNRLFLRTLRQMRDLRRYSVPVTINNPKQVNIAAEGGQQVNVQQPPGSSCKKKSKRLKSS